MDNSDEDTNGSFEFVDKVTDSSDSDNKSGDEKSKASQSSSEVKTEDKWDDVLGSGNLLKKIIKNGGEFRPERRDICKIKYECSHQGQLLQEVDEVEVQISDSELIQGLDLIIPLMYVGEVAEVQIGPRFAYGSKGLEDGPFRVPPEATLHYKIELLSSTPEPDFETLSVESRLAAGLRKKVRGNWWFSREEYQFAIVCYKRAIEYLDYAENENVESTVTKTEADQLIEERINVYNNLSAAQLKVNNAEDALTSAETVLKLQPSNVKALFRKGKALTEKGERDDALRCFKKALECEPTNKTAQIQLQKLQNLLAADSEMERNLYKKMFQPTKSNKELSQSTIRSTWIKLGVFIGSLAVAVVGVIIYKFNYLD